MAGYALVIEVARLNVTFLVVVSSAKNRSAPLAQKTLSHALDADLGSLALCVEEHNLANSTGHECVLLNGEADECGEDVALNIVGRQGAVGQRLEEELDALEKICVWVNDRSLVVVAV